MREILFRGKRVDNGEWIYWNRYGRFTDINGEPIRIKINTSALRPYAFYINELPVIREETVGDYTGLKDKDGERIFEGDIVAFDRDNRHKGDVQFDWGVFGIEWTECKHNKEMFGVWGNLHNLRTFEDGFNKDVEVIGNKWDNPELLEVKK